MIPNMIKRLAKTAYQAARHPIRSGNTLRIILNRGIQAGTTALIGLTLWCGHLLEYTDNQGQFQLPKPVRPVYFIGTLLATPAAAYLYYLWVKAKITATSEFSEIVKDGAIIAPGFIAGILLAALLFSATAYFFIGGLAMLGLLFRKLEPITRPARERVIEQQKETIKDRDETIKRREETIDQLKERLKQAGLDPDA